jgi:WD40 repeat protein
LHTVEPVLDKASHTITGMYSAHNDPNSGLNGNESDLSLNSIDINCSKDRVAVGGNQCKVHIYDDQSLKKDYLMSLKPGGSSLPGHKDRIFCVKFDKT